MSKSTTFILGGELELFIEAHVRSGLYATASEVVRAGLRALEAEETRRGALLVAIDEGRVAGCAPALDFELEHAEPSTADLCQASWWLQRVAQDAERQVAAELVDLAHHAALAGRASACTRVADWLEMRSRRRQLLLRLQAEEAERVVTG